MEIQTKVLVDYGYLEALYGLGLSYGITSNVPFERFRVNDELKTKMASTAKKLCHRDGGHNKFLEAIVVWLYVRAPRYWWQEMDTYRVGMTKQSESTMHTLNRGVRKDMFEDSDISLGEMITLEQLIECYNQESTKENFVKLKRRLPEGFMQARDLCTNYKCLRNIVQQRSKHKLPHWQSFIESLRTQLDNPELIFDDYSLNNGI